MTVRVHILESIFAPKIKTEHIEVWREGTTVADYVGEGSHVFWKNGNHVDPTCPVDDGDRIAACPQPHGAELTALQVFLLTTALNLTLSLIFAPRIKSAEPGNNASPTYGFDGLRNTRVDGLPISRAYGRMRLAGQIIGEFTESRAFPPQTDYFVLIAYGEGPFFRIGDQVADTDPAFPLTSASGNNPLLTGMEINGNPVSNFRDVEVHVRLGSNESLPIPGFTDTRLQNDVSLALTNEETTQANNPSNPNVGNGSIPTGLSTPVNYRTKVQSDPFWDQYGQAYDLTADEFDRYSFTVDWPQGLYSYNQSTGATQPAHFDVMVRYRELGGPPSFTPVTTGGPEGDGYVRVYPFQRMSVKKRNPFRRTYTGQFFDPQQFSHSSIGGALGVTGTGFARVATPTLPASWQSAGAVIQDFTVECWINVVDENSSTNFVVGHRDAGGVNGWQLRTDLRNFGPFAIPAPVPIFNITNGSTIKSYFENAFPPVGGIASNPLYKIQSGTWAHVVATVKGSSTLTMYVNGNQVGSFGLNTSNEKLVSPGSAVDIRFGDSLGAPGNLDGSIDECRILSRALKAKEVQDRYNGGAGIHGPTNASNLVGAWHFENLTDYSGNGNTLILGGATATVGVASGIVQTLPTAQPTKRSRYRLEVLRRNRDSTRSDVVDDSDLVAVTGIIDQTFVYPSTPLTAVKVRASEQLNTSAPTVTQLADTGIVPVWNGSAVEYKFSRNAAWCALDMIINETYGMGSIYKIENVDLPKLLEIADRNDEFVYDHLGGKIEITTGWSDLNQYDPTFVDPVTGVTRGRLAILMVQNVPPSHWVVGEHIGVVGINTPTTDPGKVLVDLSTSTEQTLESYEIESLSTGGSFVFIYYDRLSEGEPWLGATGGGALSAAGAGVTVTGTWEGRERRHVFDANFDQDRSAWDSLLLILGSCRARPIRRGKFLSFYQDRPRTALDIISQTSIEAGTFEITYGGIGSRANAYFAEFLDADLNYKRTPASLEDLTIKTATTASAVRRESLQLIGPTRRSEVMREMAYRLNTNRLVDSAGKFILADHALGYEVGDVHILHHDLLEWGISGRVQDPDGTNTRILVKFDRDITFAPATTYEMKIRNVFNGNYETQEVDVALTGGPGTYTAGAIIRMVDQYTFVPQDEAVWYLNEVGKDMLVSITGVTLSQDTKRSVDWIKYDADVYDDEWWEEGAAAEQIQASTNTDLLMPEQVERLRLGKAERYTTGGASSNEITLAWEHAESTRRHVASSVVWWKYRHETVFTKLLTVPGQGSQVSLACPVSDDEAGLVFAVQSVSSAGSAFAPEDSAQIPYVVNNVSHAPSGPSGLAATLSDRLAHYTWTQPGETDDFNADMALGLKYECRVGGWILGQHLWTSRAQSGEFGPTDQWVAGLTAPTLYVRALSASGQYSEVTTLSSFNPSPASARALQNRLYEDQEWESLDGAGAWGVASGAVLTNLQINASDELEFSGSNLTGTYETAVDASAEDPAEFRVRPCYVSAFATASQVWGVDPESIPIPPGHPDFGRITGEGPLFVTTSETPNCTLTIEVSIADAYAGGYGPWVPYRPEVRPLSKAKFRISVTRPNTSYQIRIAGFSTRIMAVSTSEDDLTKSLDARFNGSTSVGDLADRYEWTFTNTA